MLPSLLYAAAIPAIITMHNDTSAVSIYKKCERSVVRISATSKEGNCFGSGVVVDSNTIVTNAHVVEGAFSITVYNCDMPVSAVGAESVVVCKEHDLAIITVNKHGLKPVRMAKSMPRQGETVYTLGHPMGVPLFIASGTYNYAIVGYGGVYATFTANISPGSSGGALLNSRGELIGITTAYIGGSQSLNLAVPVEAVKMFLSGEVE